MTEKYNGWTNRETWAVALYINNDQGWLESVQETLREELGPFLRAPREVERRAVTSEAGLLVRQHVETLLDPQQYRTEYGEQQPEALAIILHDIGSLYRVDWDEIGAAFLADLEDVR